MFGCRVPFALLLAVYVCVGPLTQPPPVATAQATEGPVADIAAACRARVAARQQGSGRPVLERRCDRLADDIALAVDELGLDPADAEALGACINVRMSSREVGADEMVATDCMYDLLARKDTDLLVKQLLREWTAGKASQGQSDPGALAAERLFYEVCLRTASLSSMSEAYIRGASFTCSKAAENPATAWSPEQVCIIDLVRAGDSPVSAAGLCRASQPPLSNEPARGVPPGAAVASSGARPDPGASSLGMGALLAASGRFQGSSSPDPIGCIPCDGQARFMAPARPGFARGLGAGNPGEASIALPVPAGTLRDLVVTISAPDGGIWWFSVWVNGGPGQPGLMCQIDGRNDPAQDVCVADGSVTLQEGDRISLGVGNPGDPFTQGQFLVDWQVRFVPAGAPDVSGAPVNPDDVPFPTQPDF